MVTSRNFSLVILLLISFSALKAQSEPAQKVLATETKRFEAMIRADTLAMRRMLAEDLIYVHSNAMKESKAAHLAAIAAKKLVYEKMERESAGVRFYGKTALVNGTVKVRGILNGNAFDIRLLYSATYRKKRGAWLLVNWQSTKIT